MSPAPSAHHSLFIGARVRARQRPARAFAVSEEVEAGELVEAAREAVGPELRELEVFDVYRGDQVGEGRKSIAFRVAFQSPERTLSDGMQQRCASESSAS